MRFILFSTLQLQCANKEFLAHAFVSNEMHVAQSGLYQWCVGPRVKYSLQTYYNPQTL